MRLLSPMRPGIATTALIVLAACTGGGGGTTDSTPTDTADSTPQAVGVTVTPASTSVHVSESVDFEVTVTGTEDLGIVWSVEGAGDLGSINTDGLYVAPSMVPGVPDVIIRATSVADDTAYDEAVVTVLPAVPVPVEPWAWQGGGTSSERAWAVRPVGVQGFVMAGSTASIGEGSTDGWVVRLGADGAVQWQTVLGVTDNQQFYDVVPLASGGFVAVGFRTDPLTYRDELWLVQLDADGGVLSEQVFGDQDTWNFRVEEARALSDGRIAVVGSAGGGTYPNDVSAAFVFFLDSSGQPVSEHL